MKVVHVHKLGTWVNGINCMPDYGCQLPGDLRSSTVGLKHVKQHKEDGVLAQYMSFSSVTALQQRTRN